MPMQLLSDSEPNKGLRSLNLRETGPPARALFDVWDGSSLQIQRYLWRTDLQNRCQPQQMSLSLPIQPVLLRAKQSIDHQVTNWDSDWHLNKDYITATIQANTATGSIDLSLSLPTSGARFCPSLISGKEHWLLLSRTNERTKFSASSNCNCWFGIQHLV